MKKGQRNFKKKAPHHICHPLTDFCKKNLIFRTHFNSWKKSHFSNTFQLLKKNPIFRTNFKVPKLSETEFLPLTLDFDYGDFSRPSMLNNLFNERQVRVMVARFFFDAIYQKDKKYTKYLQNMPNRYLHTKYT
jgi:hypothetical protein